MYGSWRATPDDLVNDATLNDSDKTFTVPNGEHWSLKHIYVQLISTATVGNRRIEVHIGPNNGSGVPVDVIVLSSRVLQAASLTRLYLMADSFPDESAFDNARLLMTLPAGLIIPPTWLVRVLDVTAVDAAADDMTVRILGERISPT